MSSQPFNSAHPQPARLVVRVGVTGHRSEALESMGADLGRLRATVRHVLERVQEIAHRVRKEGGQIYTREDPLMRVISPLAEGADRLVAEEALDLHYELHCPLPFLLEEYENDFTTAESRKAFRELRGRASRILELGGNPGKRTESYLAGGRILLVNSDVLIAVWDGKPAHGEGGTAQIVEEALRLRVITVLIDAHAPHAACLWEPGSRRGVSPRRVDLNEGLGRHLRAKYLLLEHSAKPPAGSLADRLRRFFLPPPTPDRERALRFVSEKPGGLNYGLFFLFFRYLWTANWKKMRELKTRLPPFRAETSRLWSAGLESLPSRRAVTARYLNHFAWADHLAESYAGRYRSSFLVAYALGAWAVLVAFIGVVTRDEHRKPYWFLAELLFIVVILFITIRGRRRGWHERWMDYRLLAEALRQMEFLALIGSVPPSVKVPVHINPGDPQRSWSSWYFHALVREAGLLAGRIDRPYLAAYQEVLQEAIAEQAKYHRDNHKCFERLHHGPHFTAQLFFGLAAVACLLHVLPLCLPKSVEDFLGFCAIVLPSFGAAFAAVLHHGEFERVALRSQALEAKLEQLQKEAGEAQPEAAELSSIAEDFSDVMMSELIDWRFVFLDKILDLPA